ncbi:MAG: tyrosine-type recombinase/integrase [Hyphomicrobium sp.]|nr:tyrosine-type recombinase/integrase [Hyphomicrobium sp.]
MPSLKANHRQIMAAQPIDGKRTRYRIEGVPGLWLSVCPSGKRTWYVRYQPGGRDDRVFRQYTIGDAKTVGLATATKAAHDVVNKVKVHDRDPVSERVEKKRENQTFGDLFEDWYERHAKPKLARHETDRIYYNRHLKAEFDRKRLADLKRTEIARFRDKLAGKATPLVSNEALMLLNRVLNWALDEGMLEANPAARLRRAGKSKPRERVLPPGDITKLWNTLAAMESMTGDHMARAEKGRMLSLATRSIIRLLLLTGQRRSEVVESRKSELQLDGSEPVWMIPGERTKNGLLHRLPLCPMAADEFRKAVDASPAKSPFVFPSAENPLRTTVTPMAITRAMARVVAELKIARVSPHDLRRTVGTEMARLGVPLHVRSLVLNHSPQSRGVTEAVYNRYAYDKEKREALTMWEVELAALVRSPQ